MYKTYVNRNNFEDLDRRSENPVLLDDMESEVHDQLVEVFGETHPYKTV